jgi:hypothetical protein
MTNLGYGDFVKWPESTGMDRYRRGLYVFFQRTVPYPMLMTFDAPDSNLTCTRRTSSTTPLQSLNMLNDPVFFEAAQALAVRVLSEAPSGMDQRIRYAFELCIARPPDDREAEHIRKYHERQIQILRQEPGAAQRILPGALEGIDALDAAAWTGICRALLNLDEFIMRE